MDESFDDQDTEFTYEIPDCLMEGDYIELQGICHGERIIFELLTKEGSTQNFTDELPLQITLTSNGPVTVISRNKKEMAKQERFVKNGIQDNMRFELCVHASEDSYTVKLNKEVVCEQKHLLPLSKAFALSMQGKVDILSLEFKDIYFDEDEMNNTVNTVANNSSLRVDDMQSGFVRVNELRQSSIRRNDPPLLVPTRTGSKLDKQSIKSKDSNLEVTAWKTSNDLSRADLDVDYKASTLDRNSGMYSYRNSNEFSQNSDSRISATLPSVGKPPVDRITDYGMGSRVTLNSNDTPHIKAKTPIPGSRKSATLSSSKIDQLHNGEGRSQTDAGDLHRGSYYVLDDEEPVIPRITATTSTPNLQEKNKKKRFSLLGKSRKSTGSESDVRKDSKKSKGSVPDINSKSGEGEKKKKGLHLKNPFKRSKPKESTPNASSTVSLNRSEPSLAGHARIPSINVSTEDRLSKDLSKKPAPEIAAYLHKSNPSTEFDAVNLTGRKSWSEDVHFRPLALGVYHSDEYENIGSHRDKETSDQIQRKSLSSQRKLLENSPRSDIHSHLKLKGPAPEIAAVIHSKDLSPKLGDTTITEGPESHFVSITTVDGLRKNPQQVSGHNSDIANLKLKGTAPEIASSIYSKKLSPNMGETTLTQSSDLSYTPVSTVSGTGNKPFKPSGSAPEIAAQIYKNKYPEKLPYPDYSISGTSENNRYSELSNGKPKLINDNLIYKKEIRPPRKAISLSEYLSDAEGTESGGSDVYTDNEWYLEVGKSQYYFDRKRSLKNYRSKRSTRLEREARRQMGLNRNDSQESASSSISSLKPTDRKLTPKYRKRTGARKEDVSSWLNSHNSPHGSIYVDGNIKPMYKSSVQAVAPMEQQVSIYKCILKDIDQSIRGDSTIELPYPLTLGRSADVYGYFKYNSPVHQSCLVKLGFATSCMEHDEFETLYIRVWSNGGLDVLNSLGSNSEIIVSPTNFLQYTTNENTAPTSSEEQISRFHLKFIYQSFYLAITANNLFTLLVNNILPKSSNYHLKSLSLENSTNAELDRFVMPRNLILPLVIRSADGSCQSFALSLLTKLTADTRKVMIELIFETFKNPKEVCLQVVLNFEKSCLIIQENNCEIEEYKEHAKSEIEFIPEQIRETQVHWFKNSLKIFLNANESVGCSFEQHNLFNRLSHIRISGDFMLLDAQLYHGSNDTHH